MRALEGKVCLIAGTTGIGGASARCFAAAGARIVAVGRSADNAAALGRDVAALGGEYLPLAVDLAEAGAAERVHTAAVDRFSRIDVLFHVAGISGRRFGDGPLAECTDEGWAKVLEVNLTAMMRMNRACVAAWLKAGQPGVILNMASVLGFSYATQHFNTVAYATAKGGIISMSQHAAALYASQGIRINVIAPALVETPMAARATVDPAIQEFLQRKQPLTRAPLDADVCARAALYLCSDASAGVTGVVLPVDAGWCVSG